MSTLPLALFLIALVVAVVYGAHIAKAQVVALLADKVAE